MRSALAAPPHSPGISPAAAAAAQASRRKLLMLALVAAGLIALFLTIAASGIWEYVLPRRAVKIGAIALTGAATAIAAVVFQTITHNRILTPSIIGLDSLYVLIQSAVVFAFGSAGALSRNANLNFLVCVGLMLVFASVLYKVLFGRAGRNVYFLLLLGLIFGTLFQSLSSVMQVLIDPNEFLVVQSRLFASFNNVQTNLLAIAAGAVLLAVAAGLRLFKYLDVIALGKAQAVSLGVPYDRVVRQLLLIVAVLTSVSTALVGPITFLGLLVANLAYQFMRSHKHRYTLPAAALIAVIALVGGQLIVERVFTFATTVSVIINFAGGVYFLGLLLKENRSW